MGNIRKGKFFTLAMVGVALGFGPACDGGGDTGGSSGGAPSGGAVGSGGKTNTGGSKPSGGNASTGGTVNTGGGSPAGGSSVGGGEVGGSGVGGGEATTGGMAGSGSGGVIATGGVSTTGGDTSTGGVSESGGMGGAGMGGEGMGGAGPELCGGCLKVTVPLTEAGDKAFFQVDFGGPVDLANTIVTFRVKATNLGDSGSFQFYATDPTYAGNFMGWESFGDGTEFVDIPIDFSVEGGSMSSGFDASAVRWIGIDVEGNPSHTTWGEVTVLVDSIIFENALTPNQTFDTSVEGWGSNSYAVVAGSTVTYVP